MYTLYCIIDLYSFVRANGLTNKLIRIRIRIRVCPSPIFMQQTVAKTSTI